MKKLLTSLLVIAALMGFFLLMSSGTLHPSVMVLLMCALLMGLMLIRPKNTGSTQAPVKVAELLGEYGANAFTDDSPLSQEFRAAVTQLEGNMPKAALARLDKLAPQCRDNLEKYAVAIVSATICSRVGDYKRAVLEYDRAVVINPTSDIAMKTGACHQRLGQLKKARDSYEFAIDLDPWNIAAMSSLATAWVADRKYDKALEYAEMALEVEATNASALATCAICHGLLGNSQESQAYTEQAVREGYSRQKIQDTIRALKK